ncbi:MAG: hypothetical protein ACYC99_17040 [Candidatus Geothermincolia bacterium]
MKEHQVVATFEAMKNRLDELEQQAENMLRVVTILLEKVPLESEERDELNSILAIEMVKEAEKARVQVKHRRSIQELLDESQDTSKSKK